MASTEGQEQILRQKDNYLSNSQQEKKSHKTETSVSIDKEQKSVLKKGEISLLTSSSGKENSTNTTVSPSMTTPTTIQEEIKSPRKLLKATIGHRQALTPLQKSATPKMSAMVGHQEKSSEVVTSIASPLSKSKPVARRDNVSVKADLKKSTVGVGKSPSIAAYFTKSTVDTPTSNKHKPTCASTPINSGKSKGKINILEDYDHQEETTQHEPETTKNIFADKEVQTDHPDTYLITGDDAPPEYWKQLAETRRLALEEALLENEVLTKRVEELENENKIMEELVEDAKNLAQILNSMSEDSGIAADESGVPEDESEAS